jgi:hypothetical protein
MATRRSLRHSEIVGEMAMCSRSALPLSQLEVLVMIDCQATAAAARGHLLEIGWARARTTMTRAQVRPHRAFRRYAHSSSSCADYRISEAMVRDGVDAQLA